MIILFTQEDTGEEIGTCYCYWLEESMSTVVRYIFGLIVFFLVNIY